MPFINIKILEGFSRDVKANVAKRVTDVIFEETKVPKENCWIVFEDIPFAEWSANGKLLDGK